MLLLVFTYSFVLASPGRLFMYYLCWSCKFVLLRMPYHAIGSFCLIFLVVFYVNEVFICCAQRSIYLPVFYSLYTPFSPVVRAPARHKMYILSLYISNYMQGCVLRAHPLLTVSMRFQLFIIIIYLKFGHYSIKSTFVRPHWFNPVFRILLGRTAPPSHFPQFFSIFRIL